ncbi:hypothetical protein KIH39_10380 [Telmatocola sphagniphila]|uniref:Uncharacterized protein n=1 Tax=Telmatocola sphagniphila TaxID=1123043 RepID=A0A8E6B9F1_9BACT|nr:hypothetical protein [Telmatocola sphagniphila]QVL34288.1 hypothetical protein KIH39_10380 [Telmatocola sphagniphila]
MKGYFFFSVHDSSIVPMLFHRFNQEKSRVELIDTYSKAYCATCKRLDITKAVLEYQPIGKIQKPKGRVNLILSFEDMILAHSSIVDVFEQVVPKCFKFIRVTNDLDYYICYPLYLINGRALPESHRFGKVCESCGIHNLILIGKTPPDIPDSVSHGALRLELDRWTGFKVFFSSLETENLLRAVPKLHKVDFGRPENLYKQRPGIKY